MKPKEIFFIILGIALVALGAYSLYTKNVETIKAPSQKIQIKQFQISDKKITDNTNPFKIDISYPEISGQDWYNQKVKDFVDSQLADFKKNSLDNDEVIKKADPEGYAKYPREYDMTVGYTKGQIDDSVISIVFNVYTFEGGAHGSTNFYSINYSTKDKTEIKLADLFPGQADYLQKISDYCKTDLTKQITKAMGSTDGSWIADGAGPKEENYSIFLINKDGVVIYFPQYQVAPYVAGDFEVKVPKNI